LPESEEQRASELRGAAEIDDDYGDYGEEELPFRFGDVEEVPEKPVKIRLVDVPKDIKAAVGSAIRDFEMIKEGDRVLIAISGGKDSVAMVHILKYFQSVSPVKFSLGGVTVDPQVNEYKP
jgi:predicted PP-loop superfamily ATPase